MRVLRLLWFFVLFILFFIFSFCSLLHYWCIIILWLCWLFSVHKQWPLNIFLATYNMLFNEQSRLLLAFMEILKRFLNIVKMGNKKRLTKIEIDVELKRQRIWKIIIKIPSNSITKFCIQKKKIIYFLYSFLKITIDYFNLNFSGSIYLMGSNLDPNSMIDTRKFLALALNSKRRMFKKIIFYVAAEFILWNIKFSYMCALIKSREQQKKNAKVDLPKI